MFIGHDCYDAVAIIIIGLLQLVICITGVVCSFQVSWSYLIRFPITVHACKRVVYPKVHVMYCCLFDRVWSMSYAVLHIMYLWSVSPVVVCTISQGPYRPLSYVPSLLVRTVAHSMYSAFGQYHVKWYILCSIVHTIPMVYTLL